jgi:hypothetical protein
MEATMSRRWLLSLLCLLVVSILFVQNTRARLELSVDEGATVISLKELSPQLLLATSNKTGKSIDATARIDILDTDDNVVGSLSEKVTIAPGSQKIALTLPLRTRDFSPNENSRIPWYRLRYLITPLRSVQAELVAGTFSISQITPELFELQVTTPEYVRKGISCRAMVTTFHPITRKPAEGVEIKGLLKIEDKKQKHERRIATSTTTNKDGFGYLDFTLPRDIDGSDIELVVDATRGLLGADASHDLDILDLFYSFYGQASLSTGPEGVRQGTFG